MMKFWALLLLPLTAFGQSSMDQHRWYLDPHGQEVLISIDDLHDETITAVPSMDWGRSFVPSISLKKDVTIAIVDGGVEIEHPELKNHVAYNAAECHDGTIIPPKGGEDKDGNGYKGDCAGWDFVEDHNRPEDLDGHGTHVTGVIRSVMDGVKGNFRFLPLRVFAPDEGKQTVKATSPLPVRLNKAFEYAIARKVDVIHLSVGWPKSFMTYEIEQTIKKAQAAGIIVVAAAGNSSQRATIFPCQLEGVICVGALRPNSDVARFSNWGSQVDIFAPGDKILSTIPHTLAPLHISRKGYDFKNGTSQAAPFISATMALLRGAFPQESNDELYARLMGSADKAIGNKGLKGLFRLKAAFENRPVDFVFPQLKGLHGAVVDGDQKFTLKLPFKNFGQAKEESTAVTLSCQGAQFSEASQNLSAIAARATETIVFNGTLDQDLNFMNCRLGFGADSVPLRLKVLHKFGAPRKHIIARQDDLLVINTRMGGRSRFMTLNAAHGTVAGAFYYIAGTNNVTLYREDQKLGVLEIQKDCNFLRAWQVDLDRDQVNELMIESMCNKTHLLYQFLDQGLREFAPSIKYKPALTVLNYDDFEIKAEKGLPPSFRFINVGFTPPTENPWEPQTTSKAIHFYELAPVKGQDGWHYDVKVLEDPQAWVKSLGLRYLPSYQVYHQLGGKLLMKIGQKTAWVDIATQKASWAKLDDLLLLGSKKQKLHGSDDFILQSFLTPYEYRGYVMTSGVKLRFKQEDRFDPILDILGTQTNELGHLTVLRSFQRLIYLQYDFSGALLSKVETVVDRFDFLTAQDLIASVVNLPHEGKLIQLVDGTKVNSNYVDVVKEGRSKSYEVPFHCVTQQPVIMDEVPVLPLFCAKSKTEFEMKYIDL